MIEEQKGAAEAEDLIEGLGFSSLPIKPEDVAGAINGDDFKLILEAKNLQSDKILGKAVGNDKGALIYINANIPDPRRFNFTAAHEIGHVCMHIMPMHKLEFECGFNEINNPFNDPIEKEANGFASGLLMPKQLISSHTDGEVNWSNIREISVLTDASLEASYRRMSFLSREPSAMVIHENGQFRRYVPSSNFGFFIPKSPLSADQIDLAVDVKEEPYPREFERADASDWINPYHKGLTLESIYFSTVILNDGFSYTLLSYDDDCYSPEGEY
ncbi:MAG: ImmA/IrrE family metallo-endopeptidase [Candidatus Thiodiazotropha lotti]